MKFMLTIFIGFILVIGMVLGVRALNNAITPIKVTEVEQGVKCASMTSTSGVAISCWKI